MEISFRQLAIGDLGLLHGWLNEGPVLEWYAKKTSTLEAVKVKYIPRIEGKTKTDSYIIKCDDRSIGYIQTYRVTDYPEWNKRIGEGDNVAGLDLFIGDDKFRGRGIGSVIIKEFLKNVIFKNLSFSSCISGPDPENLVSIKTFEKAGFKHFKTIHTAGGDEYLMKIMRHDTMVTDIQKGC